VEPVVDSGDVQPVVADTAAAEQQQQQQPVVGAPNSPTDDDIVKVAEAKATAALPAAIAERESREMAKREQAQEQAAQQEQQRQAQEAAVAQAMALAQQSMEQEEEAKTDEAPPEPEEDFGEALEAALNAMHEDGGITVDELELLTEEIFEAEAAGDTVVGKAFESCRADPAAFKRKVRMVFKKARGGGKAD